MEQELEGKKALQRLVLRALCVLGLVFLLAYGGKFVWNSLGPFLLAALVANLWQPFLLRMEEKIPWKRGYLVLWMLFCVVLLVISLCWVVIPTLVGELRELILAWEGLMEGLVQQVLSWQERWVQRGERNPIIGEGITIAVEGGKAWVTAGVSEILGELGEYAREIPEIFLRFLVFLLACFFLSCDIETYKEKGRRYFNLGHWVAEMKESTLVALVGYFKAQAMLTAGVFLILFVGFLLMGLEFSLVIAFLIAVLDFIPMIGAGLVLVPWGVVSFLLDSSWKGWQLWGIWLLTLLFRHCLEPKVVGQQTGLSPLVSLMAVYVGLQVAGIWGMIFAPVVLLVLLRFWGKGAFREVVEDVTQVKQWIWQ